MRSNSLRFATFLVGASLTSAHSISSGCQQALVGIVTSPNAACLNLSGLLPIYLGGSNTSIVGPLNDWLSGFCSSAPCSNQTLATIVTNITTGCSNDLSATGLDSSEIITTVQHYYPTVRKILCLKDDSTNQNCITQTLANVEKTTGPLSLTKIISLFELGLNVPGEVFCSKCIKAIYNILKTDLSGVVPQTASTLLSRQCGTSSVDGQNPSGISQSAVNLGLSPSPSGAATSSVPRLSGGTVIGPAMSLLVAVSSAFVFLV